MKLIASYQSASCKVLVMADPYYWNLEVSGTCYNVPNPSAGVTFLTTAPPDTRLSYMGSALPFANEKMGLDHPKP